ncbi:galactokinase [Marinimicrobium sp. LS-A18]|uniref:galactokinase n=1 Tax=Marinimicrobium sp. LS-A18 TaxID=1381596 RepID=UPI0004B3E9F8|nr:galactokinase [Marinimicrobium sp. LS-A18]
MMDETATLTQSFERTFGRRPETVAYAPGRVNLLGEHTDYNGGFVFPAAINFGTWVAAAKRPDRTVSVLALDYSGDVNHFSLDDITQDPVQPWSNYVRGVLKALMVRHPVGGLELTITGNVPQGAGLSSSASLEIALLKAIASLYELPLSGVDAALLGQWAENEFVGCSCGVMDQMASALGKQGGALLLDCQSLQFEHRAIDPDFQIVIVDSNVKRGLVGSEYNLRRQQCEQAVSVLEVNSLREVDMERLLQAQSAMSDVVFRRARHVVSENTRTLAMARALAESDYRAVSRLMAQSHDSMRDDFEITVPPIDALVSIIQQVLGAQGGARMTGGGFGGCAVALVPTNLIDDVRRAVAEEYQKRTGLRAQTYVCTPENGAFLE